MIGLGDAAFSFQFEDSDVLATMVGDDTYENSPEKYTQHCWLVRLALKVDVFIDCFSIRWSVGGLWVRLSFMSAS